MNSPADDPDTATFLTAEEELCLIKADANLTVRRVFGPARPKAVRPQGVQNSAWVWKAFPLQQQAFDFIDRHEDDETRKLLRVYSQESAAKGQRHFIATTPEQLWKQYSVMQPSSRHFYEIIRAGQPCHLYVDIEYDLAVNPGVDGDAQVSLLVHELICCMKEYLGVTMDPGRHVIELDSTTSSKFSRHLIIQLRRAWAHYGHVHAFMELLLSRLAAKRDGELTAEVGAQAEAAGGQMHGGTEGRQIRVGAGDVLVGPQLEPGVGRAAPGVIAEALDTDRTGDVGGPGIIAREAQAKVLRSGASIPLLQSDTGMEGMCHGQAVSYQPAASVAQLRPTTQCEGNDDRLSIPSLSGAAGPHLPGFTLPGAAPSPSSVVVPGASYRNFWVRKRPPEPATVDDPDGSIIAAEADEGQRIEDSSQQRVDSVLLIDVGVYTRNSSKFGKAHTLRATRRFATQRLLQPDMHCLVHGAPQIVHTRPPSQHLPGNQPGRYHLLGVAGAQHSSSSSSGAVHPLRESCAQRATASRAENKLNPAPQGDARVTPAAKRLRHGRYGRPAHRVSAPDLFSMISDATPPAYNHQPPTSTSSTSEQPVPAMMDRQGGAGRQEQLLMSGCTREVQPHPQSILLSRGEELAVQEAVFWASLVTHTSHCHGVKPLTMFNEDKANDHMGLLRIPGITAAKALTKAGYTSTSASGNGSRSSRHQHQHNHATSRMVPGVTPWAGLNEFVQALCAKTGESGGVGSWSITPGLRPTLLLGIKGNRWCGYVGRPHKSNGVYLSVDVEGGSFVQRCHDPDCREYRSPALPLPPLVWEQMQAGVQTLIMGMGQDLPGATSSTAAAGVSVTGKPE